MTKSSYYAIIPANIRYDKSLPMSARMLYGEITALCNNLGYCYASNNYFAELYDVTPQAVSKWIQILAEKKYISLSYIKSGKEVKERRIYIVENREKSTTNDCGVSTNDCGVSTNDCGVSTNDCGVSTNDCGGINIGLTGYQQKFKGNNTYNNKFNNTDDDDNNNLNYSENYENQKSPPPPFIGEPRENYSKQVFEKFKNANLPCCDGDFFTFQSRDFRNALYKLKGYKSQEVLQAVDNYIFELKNPESYQLKEMSFDNFVGTRTFSNCLPSNYRHDNFKVFRKQGEQEQQSTEKRHFYEKCLKCGVKMMEWKNPLQKYKCDSCGSTFSWEEVDNATEHYIVP